MLRTVSIRNLSADTVTVGSYTISPFGTLVLSHKAYIALAISENLSGLDIKVSIPGKSLKYVDVQDYGAKGDGVTDDTDSIQRALDSVSFYGGGVVRIPIGVYIVDGIVVQGNTTLQGESQMDSVLKLKSGSDNAVVSFTGSMGGMEKIRVVGGNIG